jgi:hypothetical protein
VSQKEIVELKPFSTIIDKKEEGNTNNTEKNLIDILNDNDDPDKL